MDKIKKNAKQIWNSKCKYLVIVACALILMDGVNLLQTSLKFLNSDGKEVEEIKSVEIESDGWEDIEPGSFHITKSAEWTGYKEAMIRFDLDTTKKVVVEKDEEIIEESGADVILVLDTSGSMKTKDRLSYVKEGATDLVNEILSEGNHKIALITFNHLASTRSTFTTDKNKVINQINSLTPSGNTSFPNAYKAVINLLSGYVQNKNRDLVMLFLTDGSGGSAKAQYQILKDKYNIMIVGIQYDMGTSIKSGVKNITDKQYLADTTNIKSILYQSIGEATDKIQVAEIRRVENYDTFEIEDYVFDDFHVKSVDDIKVSRGSVKLEVSSDGTQKVIWTLTDNGEFKTGESATMTIKTTYQGELDSEHVYPTNIKEEISTKFKNEDKKVITSELTPQLRGGYMITYDPNLPSECNPDGKDLTVVDSAFPYDKLELPKNEYTCPGWQFKEWGFQPEGLATVDNKFLVPDSDTSVVGIWTKLEISKNMEGAISRPVEELKKMMIENAGTSISIDTEINFGVPSSETNGRGLYIRKGTENDTNPIYYYRGAVSNNHVLFAGICWQIVRTTETGGVKLIYNGTSSDGKTCVSTESNNIGSESFNTTYRYPGFVGYMGGMTSDYDSVITQAILKSSTRRWGSDVSYNPSTGEYTLINVISSSLIQEGYRYTCDSTSTTCSKVYYGLANSVPFNSIYLGTMIFTDGETFDTYKQKISENIYDSLVKKKIDDWYREVIEEKGYAKYVEDIVWCNDRTITDGPLLSKDIAVGSSLTSFESRNNLSDASANPVVKDNEACLNANDRFTVSKNIGNGALTYPVGMITADEAVLSGMSYYSSVKANDSYLCNGEPYWTMTPNSFQYSGSTAYRVMFFTVGTTSSNYVGIYPTANLGAVRPSLSLKPQSLVSINGDGTKEKPYEVVME